MLSNFICKFFVISLLNIYILKYSAISFSILWKGIILTFPLSFLAWFYQSRSCLFSQLWTTFLVDFNDLLQPQTLGKSCKFCVVFFLSALCFKLSECSGCRIVIWVFLWGKLLKIWAKGESHFARKYEEESLWGP